MLSLNCLQIWKTVEPEIWVNFDVYAVITVKIFTWLEIHIFTGWLGPITIIF